MLRTPLISLASNATAADGPTLLRLVPHWLRIFHEYLSELLIVVDMQPLSGRIAELQRGAFDPDGFKKSVHILEMMDSRVRFVPLESIEPEPIQRRWFGKCRPIRCQGGTPILAFVAAIEEARSDIVLRFDCDMLFCERGWLEKDAIPSLNGGIDVYEPPRLRVHTPVSSSRAFMVSKSRLDRMLPLRSLRLDPLRILHRWSLGRPTWLALEAMLTRAAEGRRLNHRIGQSLDLGFSLHGLKRKWTAAPWFDCVIRSVEAGDVPKSQRDHWDFNPEFWSAHCASQYSQDDLSCHDQSEEM